MKHLIFPLFAAMLLAACQNSTTTPPPSPVQEPVQEQMQNKPVTKVDVLQTIAKSKTLIEDANGFVKDLAALPEATKTANKDMVETLNKYAAGILEKQPQNVAAMESAIAQGDNIANPEEVRKLIAATDEYARHMDGFRSRIQQLQNGQAK